MSNAVQLQIIFCSCVNETTLVSFLRENSTSLRFPKIFIKKQTRRSNDKTTIELGYRLSFVCVSANNWSARHWQSRYFVQTCPVPPAPHCPIIVYSFKIFLLFWLAKIPQLILHNQLALTKFRRHLRYPVKWRQKYRLPPTKGTATEKLRGQDCVKSVCFFFFGLRVLEHDGNTFLRRKKKQTLLPKNMARKVKIQLSWWQLLFRLNIPSYREFVEEACFAVWIILKELLKQFTTTENTITYHNALCLSP